MDEAKSLVNMAVAAMFAAMFLGAAIGLVSISYMLWSYYSREDAANQKMSDYANYTAFDNTTVRGQEVAQLISDADGDFFVMIFDGRKGSPNADGNYSIDTMDISSAKPVLLYTAGAGTWMEDKTIQVDDTFSNNQTVERLLNKVKSMNGTRIGSISATHKLTPNDSIDHIQALFLKSDTGMAENERNLGLPDKDGYYAAFKSALIYDDDGTTDILGVVLVRQAAETNQF